MPKPNTADAMKRFRAGNAGFTDKAHLKAKGLIPRADGTKKKSPKYEDAPANATGTAVAGTGDDSSTVVVKKKKDQENASGNHKSANQLSNSDPLRAFALQSRAQQAFSTTAAGVVAGAGSVRSTLVDHECAEQLAVGGQ